MKPTTKLIPQPFIDELIARTDIVELISESISLKKAGQNYSACCPFHQEKTPSFQVNRDKQFYYCFGCGASGNALSFLVNHHTLSFPAAVEQLAQNHGLEVPKEHFKISQDKQKKMNILYAMTEMAALFYEKQYTLKAHQFAQDYFEQRGILPETIKQFRLGYAPSEWHALHDFLIQKNYTNEQLISSGLLVKNESQQRLYDRFRHRVMFPIRDIQGKVTAFGGRILNQDNPKYLNSSETSIFQKSHTLYGLYEAKQCNKTLNSLLVVEGYMDVIALFQHGITEVVATLGTAITADHIKRLFRQTQSIIFCYDGDLAGKKAAWRALTRSLPLLQDGYRIQFLFLPEAEDPDSFIFKKGVDFFKDYINQQAISLDVYLFQELAQRVDLNSLEGKAKFVQLAKSYIQKLPSSAYQTLITQEITKYTGLTLENLNHLIGLEADLPAMDTSDTQAKAVSAYTKNHNMTSSHEAFPPVYSYNIPTIKASVVHRIIKILLYYPHFSADITLETLQKLQQDSRKNTQLLITLIQFLQKTLCNNVSMIQGSWYNTSLGQLLIEAQLLELPDSNQNIDLKQSINQLIEKINQDKLASSPTQDKLHLLRKRATMRSIP